MFTYKTSGTCARAINLELDGDIITYAEVVGGCPGNTTGLGKLVVGRSAHDIIERVEGITCGFKPTSCPDQMAKALKAALEEQKKQG